MEKLANLFIKKVIGKSFTLEERVHEYVTRINYGKATIEDVIELEEYLECDLVYGRFTKDRFFELMLQYGYTINQVRAIEGLEPVGYGDIQIKRNVLLKGHSL
ncbi:hypothetical protein [Paenibacillus sp. NPDC093718]|uniref:hypothetical protein n=1 Tax=Paenibacillus sp. NPDC093718 TaxID=3390601 RepID=UPI003CFECD5F